MDPAADVPISAAGAGAIPEPIEIARLEERRLADALEHIAPHSQRFAGGIVARAEPGSWMNRGVGFGLVQRPAGAMPYPVRPTESEMDWNYC